MGGHHRPQLFATLVTLPLLSLAQNSGWLNPDASQSDFSSSYHNSEGIVFAWEGLNQSLSDLWISSYDTTNPYSLRIATNINITGPGNLPWTVTVSGEEIDLDDRFRLHFVPTGTAYVAGQSDQIESPGFLLLQPGDVDSSSPSTTAVEAPSSTISTASLTSTTEPTPSATASPSSEDSGISTGTKIGAAVAVVGFLIITFALAIWVVRLRRRVKAANNHRSAGIFPTSAETQDAVLQEPKPVTVRHVLGVHEARGDHHQPAELSALKRQSKVYEMAA
jgi:hypothetical protein